MLIFTGCPLKKKRLRKSFYTYKISVFKIKSFTLLVNKVVRDMFKSLKTSGVSGPITDRALEAVF